MRPVREMGGGTPQRICMFVYNNCAKDVRVLKEAATLAQAGHEVRVIAVQDKTTPPREERDGFLIIRINRDPIHYRLLRGARRTRRAMRLLPGRDRVRAGLASPGPPRLLRSTRRLLRPLAVLGLPWHLMYAATERARQRALLILQRLVARGHRPAPPEAEQGGWRGSRIAYRTLMRFHKPLMFLDYYIRAYRYAHEQPADTYHAHDLNTLPVAAALAARGPATLVYDSHELYPEVSTLSSRERRIWSLLEQRLIGRSDRVVTVCDSIADELSRRHGIERPLVVLNCPPRMREPAPPRVNLLREKVGLQGSREPIVLYHGGFLPYRGLEALVGAAAHLERGVIVLMGWGRLEERLRREVAAHGVEDRVIVTGPVSGQALISYTAGADVGVIPYEAVGLNNYYTTPNKLFEYMAVGMPIAASRLPELVRFVQGYDIGLTFAPGDPHSIADALNQLLADPDLRRRMATNAARASAEFCWERESMKLLNLYEHASST